MDSFLDSAVENVRLHAFGGASHAAMITISKEDYLKAIAEAEAEG
jgi:hypothetical protein